MKTPRDNEGYDPADDQDKEDEMAHDFEKCMPPDSPLRPGALPSLCRAILLRYGIEEYCVLLEGHPGPCQWPIHAAVAVCREDDPDDWDDLAPKPSAPPAGEPMIKTVPSSATGVSGPVYSTLDGVVNLTGADSLSPPSAGEPHGRGKYGHIAPACYGMPAPNEQERVQIIVQNFVAGGTEEQMVRDIIAYGAAIKAQTLEEAAKHCPFVKIDAHEAWLICSCGWRSSGKPWKEGWAEHIRALATPERGEGK
jgi:hypothetical protein